MKNLILLLFLCIAFSFTSCDDTLNPQDRYVYYNPDSPHTQLFSFKPMIETAGEIENNESSENYVNLYITGDIFILKFQTVYDVNDIQLEGYGYLAEKDSRNFSASGSINELPERVNGYYKFKISN